VDIRIIAVPVFGSIFARTAANDASHSALTLVPSWAAPIVTWKMSEAQSQDRMYTDAEGVVDNRALMRHDKISR